VSRSEWRFIDVTQLAAHVHYPFVELTLSIINVCVQDRPHRPLLQSTSPAKGLRSNTPNFGRSWIKIDPREMQSALLRRRAHPRRHPRRVCLLCIWQRWLISLNDVRQSTLSCLFHAPVADNNNVQKLKDRNQNGISSPPSSEMLGNGQDDVIAGTPDQESESVAQWIGELKLPQVTTDFPCQINRM
jgi:hypothetical protein